MALWWDCVSVRRRTELQKSRWIATCELDKISSISGIHLSETYRTYRKERARLNAANERTDPLQYHRCSQGARGVKTLEMLWFGNFCHANETNNHPDTEKRNNNCRHRLIQKSKCLGNCSLPSIQYIHFKSSINTVVWKFVENSPGDESDSPSADNLARAHSLLPQLSGVRQRLNPKFWSKQYIHFISSTNKYYGAESCGQLGQCNTTWKQ